MTGPISDLRAVIRGPVLAPGDDGYDTARAVVLGDVDPRPGAIVRVADAEDVRQAVLVARKSGASLAVRSGGHGASAFGTVDADIVIDVRGLDGFDIDVEGRTAWAGSGLTAGAYTTAAAAYGLATGFGDTGSVGLGGIVLGGGVGYLSRRHGLTIDNLLAVEIVTAEGEIRIVDAVHEPDLFWALRGGGGNFGVATRFQLRLHPVAEVVGGMLFLPATPDVVAGFIAAAGGAPDELSTIANVMPCPPMPFVPETHHGRPVVFALLCWAGAPDSAGRALAPFRALAAPVADLVRAMPYPELYPPDDPDYHPLAVSRTLFVDAVSTSDAAAMVEGVSEPGAPMRVVQLRVLGGAIARVPVDATAYAHRARPIMGIVASFYAGPDNRAAAEGWIGGMSAALAPAPGAYVNFLGDEGPARVREAYPGSIWDRLAAIKARYDPDNLFRRTQNIPPARG